MANDFSKAGPGQIPELPGKEGSNVVLLDADVAKAFPDSASGNEALRVVMKGSLRQLGIHPTGQWRRNYEACGALPVVKPVVSIGTWRLRPVA